MKCKKIGFMALVGVLGLAGVCCYGRGNSERKNRTTKTEETSVTTNDNGIISKSFTEFSVTTNGCMVTEHRRETRTNTDLDGNVLETSTSEFAQSFSLGSEGAMALSVESEDAKDGTTAPAGDAAAPSNDSFLGLVFGEEFTGAEFQEDPEQPMYERAIFTPEKPLDGFDEYYVYVTPKTHRIAKIYACARDAVEPGPRWRNHYLIEALEKRYGTWARPSSYHRPCFVLAVGDERFVTICLTGATREYQTVIMARDAALENLAGAEYEEIRMEARKMAAEKRAQRVQNAADAF